ncbi:MAG: hypothetical protein IPM98_19945 [Lewinellaceae bacterium]|nr:hypothetical protein [Lewinellaceae bacterium]
MHNVRFFCNQTLLALTISLLLPALATAQTEEDPFERLDSWKRRMDERMRQNMSIDSLFGSGRLHISPDSNSVFYFRIDTSFSGSGTDFFDFKSFGIPDGQDFFSDDFFGFDRFFEQFFNDAPPRPLPRDRSDDGNPAPSDDDLLPEERLRRQEQRAPASKESKVKTIRI